VEEGIPVQHYVLVFFKGERGVFEAGKEKNIILLDPTRAVSIILD